MPDISTVILSVGGWIVGIFSATYLQDRARKARGREIAGALLAEVRRLQDELGYPFSVGALVPTVNPWVQSAFVDAAGADPRLVEHFLTLERHLFNLRSQQNICQGLTSKLSAETAPLEHSQRSAQDQEQVRAKIHERALGTLTELEKLLTAIAGQRPLKPRWWA